jgi:hypothetical protein
MIFSHITRNIMQVLIILSDITRNIIQVLVIILSEITRNTMQVYLSWFCQTSPKIPYRCTCHYFVRYQVVSLSAIPCRYLWLFCQISEIPCRLSVCQEYSTGSCHYFVRNTMQVFVIYFIRTTTQVLCQISIQVLCQIYHTCPCHFVTHHQK